MNATLAVAREKPDDPLKALDWDPSRLFKYHIDARSLSNITAFRRELEKFHGDDIDWSRLLHDAIRAAEADFLGRVHSVNPEWGEDEAKERDFLVQDVFPTNAVSCVFGMGEAGKSLSLQAALTAASSGTDWVGKRTVSQNTLWLDYESEDQRDFARRRLWLQLGGSDFYPGSIRWMPAYGIPLSDLKVQLRAEMERFHSKVLVIDSVVYASGGNPNDAESAVKFFSALSSLPISTKILIAHTNKGESDRYPFGSIFWHNGVHGMSWYLKSAKEENVLNVGWYGRKASNFGKQKEFAVKFSFGEGNAVTTSRGNLTALNREIGQMGLREEITMILEDGAQSVQELVRETGREANIIRARLSDMKDAVVKLPDGRWGLRYGT